MLPKDPFMMLSVINTRLRDEYKSFEELCASMDVNGDEVVHTLEALDYHYDSVHNQFI